MDESDLSNGRQPDPWPAEGVILNVTAFWYAGIMIIHHSTRPPPTRPLDGTLTHEHHTQHTESLRDFRPQQQTTSAKTTRHRPTNSNGTSSDNQLAALGDSRKLNHHESVYSQT